MRITITVRADESLRAALSRRAKLEGRTVSELVRQILRDAVAERPMSSRAAHLRGQLDTAPDGDPWRERLRERNWRP